MAKEAISGQNIEDFCPTEAHIEVTNRTIDYLSQFPSVEAVILICSCARKLGTRDIDYAALLYPETSDDQTNFIEREWLKAQQEDPVFNSFRQTGLFYQIDLWLTNGLFQPKYQPHLLSQGPDTMERDIGNLFIYSVPLSGKLNRFNQSKNNWLPYYDKDLQKLRLFQAKSLAIESADYVTWDHNKGHHYLALKRLQNSLEYFLHGLFISRSVYPLAYDKWLQEQCNELLDMPELYSQLTDLLNIPNLTSDKIHQSAQCIKILVDDYLVTD